MQNTNLVSVRYVIEKIQDIVAVLLQERTCANHGNLEGIC